MVRKNVKENKIISVRYISKILKSKLLKIRLISSKKIVIDIP